VGIGLVGTTTVISSSSVARWISPWGGPVMKPIDQPRIFQQHHLPKGGGLLGQHAFENLLEGAVDVAHHRHLVDQTFAQPHHQPPDIAGGEGPHQSQQRQDRQQTQTGNTERHELLGIVLTRDQRRDGAIDEVDEQPGQIDRNPGRRCHQHPGEKIGTEARCQAEFMRRGGLFRAGRHGRRRFFLHGVETRSWAPGVTGLARSI